MKTENNENEALNKTDVMQSVILPQEVRIGNYLERACGVGFFETTLEDLEHIESGSKCKRIPLTEQWILKLGFSWSIPHQAYYKEGFDYVIDFYETYPNVDSCLAFINKNHRSGEKLITVKFVHELQNLHYVLTQRELTVA